MFAIWRWGSEEQKQAWLPAMAAGEKIGCFGLTEPDFGSNPAGMRTVARRDGDDWVLNGTKMWITDGIGRRCRRGVGQADADGDHPAGVRGFVVPPARPGFSAPKITKKLSLRASITSELVLEDVRLPADGDIPRRGRTQGTPVLLERSPVRHRVRSAGCRPGLPGDHHRLRR